MSIGALLWSFRGRINRNVYWLVGIAVVIGMSVLLGLVLPLAGVDILTGDFAGGIGVALLILVLGVPFIWIGLALGAKRLHDRNRSAWWLLVFYLLPSVLESAGGFMGGMAPLFALAGLAISIWGLIELGFLRGTTGPNRYGPDPLAPAELPAS